MRVVDLLENDVSEEERLQLFQLAGRLALRNKVSVRVAWTSTMFMIGAWRVAYMPFVEGSKKWGVYRSGIQDTPIMFQEFMDGYDYVLQHKVAKPVSENREPVPTDWASELELFAKLVRRKFDAAPSLNLGQLGLSFIKDGSVFGISHVSDHGKGPRWRTARFDQGAKNAQLAEYATLDELYAELENTP